VRPNRRSSIACDKGAVGALRLSRAKALAGLSSGHRSRSVLAIPTARSVAPVEFGLPRRASRRDHRYKSVWAARKRWALCSASSASAEESSARCFEEPCGDATLASRTGDYVPAVRGDRGAPRSRWCTSSTGARRVAGKAWRSSNRRSRSFAPCLPCKDAPAEVNRPPASRVASATAVRSSMTTDGSSSAGPRPPLATIEWFTPPYIGSARRSISSQPSRAMCLYRTRTPNPDPKTSGYVRSGSPRGRSLIGKVSGASAVAQRTEIDSELRGRWQKLQTRPSPPWRTQFAPNRSVIASYRARSVLSAIAPWDATPSATSSARRRRG
jgi:hypothetical protein